MLVMDDGQGMMCSLCRKHIIWVTPYPIKKILGNVCVCVGGGGGGGNSVFT